MRDRFCRSLDFGCVRVHDGPVLDEHIPNPTAAGVLASNAQQIGGTTGLSATDVDQRGEHFLEPTDPKMPHVELLPLIWYRVSIPRNGPAGRAGVSDLQPVRWQHKHPTHGARLRRHHVSLHPTSDGGHDGVAGMVVAGLVRVQHHHHPGQFDDARQLGRVILRGRPRLVLDIDP